MWTDEVPTENGFYWWKRSMENYPVIKRVTDSYIYDENVKYDQNINDIKGFWLGPLSPSN